MQKNAGSLATIEKNGIGSERVKKEKRGKCQVKQAKQASIVGDFGPWFYVSLKDRNCTWSRNYWCQ